MSFKHKSSAKSKFNPCVIESVKVVSDEFFIVGTYSLVTKDDIAGKPEEVESKLLRVNNRLGSLVVIEVGNGAMKVLDEHECADGGVFDIKISDSVEEWRVFGETEPVESTADSFRVMACHSNGVLAVYSVVIGSDREVSIKTLRRYPTKSSLLTTFTPIIFNSFSVVANSGGELIAVDLKSEPISGTVDTSVHCSKLSVTECAQPIWSLYCHRLDDNTNLMFVGSDDSRLRIFCLVDEDLRDHCFPHLEPIEVTGSQEFTAGVTSFALDYHKDQELSLIIGSYDELIRYYTIDLAVNHKPKSLSVTLKKKIHIPGSGIWRVITGKGSEGVTLVAGMYSGAHLIKDMEFVQTLDGYESESEDKHLIYGLNCDLDMNYILMSSFYSNNIYLFAK